MGTRGSKPGERFGGRQKGTLNKKSQRQKDLAEKGGMSPIEYLLSVMREPLNEQSVRMDAAAKVAPYVHAKLAAVEMNANVTVNHEDALNELK